MTPANATLIRALQDPRLYDHPVEGFRLIETHVSWVLLTGRYAYKIKKPLDLGFLDFSTLEKRRFYCQEELRLNRRLAPQLYLDVVAITGTPEAPVLNGAGDAFEYAVKMVQFPSTAQLDQVLARGELEPGHIDDLAHQLAQFHARVAVAGPGSPFGTPDRVYFPVGQNFDQIRPLVTRDDLPQLDRLQRWSEQTYAALREALAGRKRDGFIRECHGDAHLANMALLDGRVVVFDCLEFNENLRWIDVINEIAFLVMDLNDRRLDPLGWRCLNTYLEDTGDYAGLTLFQFYRVYRALVRAKVASIRLGQGSLPPEEEQAIRHRYRGYADLAERYTRPGPTPLVITHGLPGSGKTVQTGALLEHLGAIRVRSDVERKRLHGLGARTRSGSPVDAGLYTAEASRLTYERLADLARGALRAGFPVIVDAAFPARAQRARFRALAAELGVPFRILDIQTPQTLLRERVARRERAGGDASEAGVAVLERQLGRDEPLAEEELELRVTVDGTRAADGAALAAGLT